MDVYMCVCVNVCACMSIWVYVYMCVGAYMCTCICAYVHAIRYEWDEISYDNACTL